MLAEPVDGSADRRQHACRRTRIVLYDEFANRFEIVERRCTPNDLHARSRFLRLWPRQLAVCAPGLHPLHDVFVRYSGTAGFVFRQCRLNMGGLPGVEIDVCLNRLARQMRSAPIGVTRESIELLPHLGLQANGDDHAPCHRWCSRSEPITVYHTVRRCGVQALYNGDGAANAITPSSHSITSSARARIDGG